MGFFVGLISYITGLSAVALQFVAAVFSAKIAVRVAVLAIMFGIFLAALAGITVLVNELSYTVPEYIAQAWSFLIPSNFVPCVSAVFAIQGIIWVWSWQQFAIIRTAFG